MVVLVALLRIDGSGILAVYYVPKQLQTLGIFLSNHA